MIKEPVKTQLQFLPFEDLSWENFEQLCLKLAQEMSSLQDCERYGKQGSTQQGIDIFQIYNDGRYDTYQCKREKKINISDLDKVIEAFKNGKYYKTSKSFTICTSCELNTTKLQDTFNRYKVELWAEGIELKKWDKIQLSLILKNHSALVLEFFGEYWLKEFLGIDKLSPLYTMTDCEINERFILTSCELSIVNNTFINLPKSHIERKETNELFNWTIKPLEKEESNVCVLAGNAGTGKTVILKDLFNKLIVAKIPVLGFKADKTVLDTKNILGFETEIDSVFNKLLSTNSIIVVLIDQIDALSQSLSNNRDLIDTYTTFINKISYIPGIRVIISCRIFDLNRDAELRQYINRKEIKLALLTDEEVRFVVNQLPSCELDSFPEILIELLKTPLHLDLFCRIYNERILLNGIKTSYDLYKELWKIKVQDVDLKTDIKYQRLKEFLYKLSETIYQRQGNLSAPAILFDAYIKEIEYLKTEFLIVEYQNSELIQFFHQSFYDYTFSRCFVENKGGDIYQFLLSEHQGLFIRSLVKQVLIYLRLYDPYNYNLQIRNILLSDKIRYHIKLILIDQLAFEESPTTDEIEIIQQLSKNNQRLLIAFFNSSPQIGWFDLLYNKKKDFLIQLLNCLNEQLRNSVASFIVFSGDNNIDIAYGLLSQIKDSENRNAHIRWMLYRSKDFSSQKIQDTYCELDANFIKHDSDRYHILRNAVKTAPEFTIEQARKLFINSILPNWEKKRRSELAYDSAEREFYHLCEDLYKSNPIKSYQFFREIILTLANGSIYESYRNYNKLKINYAFNVYDPDAYEHHKLIDWIVEALYLSEIDDFEFTFSEVSYYLSSELSTCRLIALKFLSKDPLRFKEIVLDVIVDKEFVEDCFYDESLKYQFRTLLNNAYHLYSFNEQNRINTFILSFNHFLDKTAQVERHKLSFTFPIYSHLWHTQWLLMNSIPSDEIQKHNNLYSKLYELNRRFKGWNSENKQPNHGMSLSQGVGGLVSKEKYKKFTQTNWYNSFIELNEDVDFHNHRYISLDEHAKAFKEAVSEKADSYFPFILKVVKNENIHFRYKLCGLEGLADSNFDIEKIRKLYGILLNQDVPNYYFYSFIRFGQAFINNSFVDVELINFWKRIALDVFEKRDVTRYEGSKEIVNDKLFAEGMGTTNGEALSLIVNLSLIDDYRDEIYEYLISISCQLPIQLRLVVMSEVNAESSFSNEQLLKLFLKYNSEITTEIYYVAPNLINSLFCHFFESLVPLVKQTLYLPQTTKFLGVHLFYGWLYGYETSKELLLDLHERYPVSIRETLNEACNYYYDIEYREKCHYMLNLYAKDKRKEVREAFSFGFYKLPSDCFHELRPIIDEYVNYIDEDRLSSLYNYLFPVAKDYPRECIDIQHVIYDKKRFKYDSELKEPIELFTLCYNAIKEFDTGDRQLEYTMDVFDKLLEKSNFRIEIDKILKEVED